MRNLFNQLFPFRPRENSSAEENFLTESFTYFLEHDKAVLEAFVSRVLRRRIDVERYEVKTRFAEQLGGRTLFPDLKLILESSRGERYIMFSEHKWNSGIRPDQLVDYDQISRSIEADDRHLVTIVARADQKRAAESTHISLPGTHLLWEDIYLLLESLNNKNQLLCEFLRFMETNNLNPGKPINSATMKAFLLSTDFKAQLSRFTNKLLNEYGWTTVPKAFHSKVLVRDRFGRVGIEFQTTGWNPTLVVGFLYDPRNHMVSLTAPNESVDLFLRLEADPRTNPQIDEVLALLRQKAKLLTEKEARVLTRNETGNDNLWTLLIAQQSLASFIANASEEREQIEAIYNRVQDWLNILFKDGTVEKALITLKPTKSAVESEASAATEIE
jgi:hypothetical protein